MSEAQLSLLFDEARAELSKINKQTHGAKQRVIKDLANKLLDGKLLAKDAIAEEIKHQLKGHVSSSLVDKVLGVEYKDAERSESGRKGAATKKNSKNIPAKPVITVTAGGESLIEDMMNPEKPKVVSEPYSAGAKKDREATYTERQAALIQELQGKLNAALKRSKPDAYNDDVTQELIDAQIRIKELEAPFDYTIKIDIGRHRVPAKVHVRPAMKEVTSITILEEDVPAGAF